MNLLLQVNGKAEGEIELEAKDFSALYIKAKAITIAVMKHNVSPYSIQNVVYIPNKLVNIVLR